MIPYKRCKGCFNLRYPMIGQYCNPCQDKIDKVLEKLKGLVKNARRTKTLDCYRRVCSLC